MTLQLGAYGALRGDNDRLRRTLDLVQRSIILIGVDGRLLLFNDALCKTLGYTRGELKALGADAMLPGAHLVRIARPGGFSTRHRGQLTRKDGSTIAVEFSLSAFPEEGEAVGTLVELRDIAEEQRLSDQLLLFDRDEVVGSIVAGMAHDFNNLLTIIGVNIEAAAQSQHRKKDLLQRAQVATDQAGAIVEQLLELSRRTTPVRSAVNLSALAGDVVVLARDAIDRRIDLAVEAHHDPVFVLAENGQLQQVLLNLLLNANDALVMRMEQRAPGNHPSDRYRPRIAVEVCIDHEGDAEAGEGSGRATLTVRDNGVGMSSAVRERIFEPFFTTKAVGKGTGLGLSTAHAIVAKHQGTCSVSSEPGRGSTFVVTLPLTETTADRDGRPPLTGSGDDREA